MRGQAGQVAGSGEWTWLPPLTLLDIESPKVMARLSLLVVARR